MKRGANIKGFNKVMNNLNAEIKAIKGRSLGGLIDGAIIIRNDMDKTPPLIPVDTNNLRASWYTTPLKSLRKIGLIIGFSANYAAFVHEMVDADFTSTRTRYGPGPNRKRIYTPRTGAGAKFFEASVKRNKEAVLQVIRDSVNIKK